MTPRGLFVAGAVAANAANVALLTYNAYRHDAVHPDKLASRHVLTGLVGALFIDTLSVAPMLTAAALARI